MNWDSMVTVGRIVRPHGHKGAVVVVPETDFAADRFAEGAELLWNRGAGPEKVRITRSWEYRGRWVVTLDGITTMNDAETLRDVEFRVSADALHPLDAGAHYVHDLAGCVVMTTTGVEVGRVADVKFGSGTPLLVVTRESGGDVLVPFAAEICREIDTAAKRIVVAMPDGLLNLNVTGQAGRRP